MSRTHVSQYFHKVLVRSRDRFQSTDTSQQFKLHFRETIEGKHRVRWCTIPNTLYNVNATNNSLTATNGGSATVTIPPGNYNGSTLAAALAAALLAATGVAHTVTFNTTTFRLTITPAAGTTNVVFTNSYYVVGAPIGNVAVTGATTLPFVINLGLPLSLGIQINEAGGDAYTTAYNTTQPTMRGTVIVPLLADFSVFNFVTDKLYADQSITFPNGVNQFTISVVDPGTNLPVDLNGAEWEMLIERDDRAEMNHSPWKRQRVSEYGVGAQTMGKAHSSHASDNFFR